MTAKNPFNHWGHWGSFLKATSNVVNFQPVEVTVLEQGQSQGKANAWHQAAFLQELLGKALEDTGTLNQENRHHWETQTGWGIPRALQATTGSVWLLQERVCVCQCARDRAKGHS